MSFVLDALLKAQAQRARGGVPTVRAGLSEGPVPPLRRGGLAAVPRWGWIVLALVVMGLVAIGLLAWQRAAAPASGSASESVLKAGPEVVVPPAPAPPPIAGSAPSPLPTPVAEPAREPASLPAPVAAASPAASTTAAPQPAPVPPAAPAMQSEPAPQAASLPAPDAGPVPARQALPAELQSQLPPLALSGTVYASDPVQRMAIVNGEVWRQGDQIAPGLVLEEIRRKDAVLSFKGQRFSISP